MEQMNRIELKGNVGSVRINDMTNGRMARLSIATNYLFKTREGDAGIETTWLNIVAWESKYIQDLDKIEKGTSVHVIGRLRSVKFTASDGTEKQSYEVVANRLNIIEDEPDNY